MLRVDFLMGKTIFGQDFDKIRYSISTFVSEHVKNNFT
jgi:hypothetical protein